MALIIFRKKPQNPCVVIDSASKFCYNSDDNVEARERSIALEGSSKKWANQVKATSRRSLWGVYLRARSKCYAWFSEARDRTCRLNISESCHQERGVFARSCKTINERTWEANPGFAGACRLYLSKTAIWYCNYWDNQFAGAAKPVLQQIFK